MQVNNENKPLKQPPIKGSAFLVKMRLDYAPYDIRNYTYNV